MKPLALLPVLALISACSSTVHTTSGAAFLADRNSPVDADIAAAAAGEPDLHFPARIGVARINSYAVTDMSQAEHEVVAQLAEAAKGLGQVTFVTDFGSTQNGDTAIHDARLHGAEQHLDYVLVYEVDQLSRGLDPKGRIQTAFVDVRNGYVYGRSASEASLAGLGVTREGWGDYTPSDRGAAKLMETALPDVAEILNALAARAN